MTSAFVRAAAFSLLALAAAAHAAPYPADVEAVYAARFTDISTSGRGELSRYDPLEPIIGAAPRKGTCSIKMPASRFSTSPTIFMKEPGPVEP